MCRNFLFPPTTNERYANDLIPFSLLVHQTSDIRRVLQIDVQMACHVPVGWKIAGRRARDGRMEGWKGAVVEGWKEEA